MGRYLRAIAVVLTGILSGLLLGGVTLQAATVVTLHGNNSEVASTIKVLPDNSIVVIGRTNSFGAGAYDVLAVKIDREGNVVWGRTYGGSGGALRFDCRKWGYHRSG